MKVVIIGSKQLACDMLTALLDRDHSVVAVFARDQEEGMKVWHDLGHGSLAKLAREKGIPVYEGINVNSPEALQVVQELSPDVIFSCFWGEIFKEPILNIPKLGVFNLHTAYLPKNRGSRPIPWSIIEGETYTGITMHKMMTGVDNGPIVSQARVGTAEDDTAESVYANVVRAGAELFREALPLFENGSYSLRLQDESQATYHPRGEPYGGQINAFWDEARKDRFRRAMYFPPFKGHTEAPSKAIDGKAPRVYAMVVLDFTAGLSVFQPAPAEVFRKTEALKSAAKELEASFGPSACLVDIHFLQTIAAYKGLLENFLPGEVLLRIPMAGGVMATKKHILEGSQAVFDHLKHTTTGLAYIREENDARHYKFFDAVIRSGKEYICGMVAEGPGESIEAMQPFRHENGMLEIPVAQVSNANLSEVLAEAEKAMRTYDRDVFLGLSVCPGDEAVDSGIGNPLFSEIRSELHKVGGDFLTFGAVADHFKT